MNNLRLVTYTLLPRRDKRIRTCRRWRWGRLIGWALAIGVWTALWAAWWVIPV